ncbi:MarR family winged helix-turn-helix transcriptional regulator [Brevundimonas sp.]|uniref:MarR family winged helix-turn-helix transcriptional regulator n=1 Tax=Brevundimonas sp. TaxID=1871086 RepID=UPI001A336DCD|nr:MarR family winged helix-turn-helix transcriptional regulator [Brevundimonas sp.]MBJ7483657.1 winged helix-turn-helix transcriptional regulator [Brevundimonas sp.]
MRSASGPHLLLGQALAKLTRSDPKEVRRQPLVTDPQPAAPPPKPSKLRPRDFRLDDYLPYQLSVASNEVSNWIASAYEAKFGVTIPQWRLMAVLGGGGEATPLELRQKTVMDKVTVSRAAKGLLDRGLIEGRDNLRDGRSHILSLSAAGLDLYRTIAPVALAFEAALLDQWSPEEVSQLKQQLRKLHRTASVLTRLP